MKNLSKTILSTIILAIGLLLFLYPDFQTWQQKQQAEQALATFAEYKEQNASDNDQEGGCNLKLLRKELKKYNARLLKKGQELIDCWSYESNPIDLQYMPENSDTIGRIRIPDMDVELPLLLGASTENMAQGAVVLSETSMPIGGTGTNCVIAGHRGYRGIPYFRNIQDLQIGSKVYIDNPWETLEYEVVATNIIWPDDLSCLKIRKHKDMVTLITCHPYMGHSKYRYVVYCQRVGSDTSAGLSGMADNAIDEAELAEQNQHSQMLVQLEIWLRYILVILFVVWWLVMLLRRVRDRRKK